MRRGASQAESRTLDCRGRLSVLCRCGRDIETGIEAAAASAVTRRAELADAGRCGRLTVDVHTDKAPSGADWEFYTPDERRAEAARRALQESQLAQQVLEVSVMAREVEQAEPARRRILDVLT